MPLGVDILHIPLKDLHPDPRNPRLPAEDRDERDESALLKHLADSFDAIALAESIARHGYFSSEPLIVTKEDDRWIVLEGNRRLSALCGLAVEDLRASYANSARWNEAAAKAKGISLDFEVPAIEAETREDADAVIGFRHIGSLMPWKPVQRAQFLAHLIDEGGVSFEEAADTVGEEVDVVKMLYRNQAIIERTRELGNEAAAADFSRRFGIFTTALNRTQLRTHVGVVRVADVDAGYEQIDEDDLEAVTELWSWLYGTEEESKVIRESREIRLLAEVVENPEALAELRNTRDLYAAHALIKSAGPPEPASVMRSLAMGVGHVRSAASSIDVIAAEERTKDLSTELADLSEAISWAVDQTAGDSDGKD